MRKLLLAAALALFAAPAAAQMKIAPVYVPNIKDSARAMKPARASGMRAWLMSPPS